MPRKSSRWMTLIPGTYARGRASRGRVGGLPPCRAPCVERARRRSSPATSAGGSSAPPFKRADSDRALAFAALHDEGSVLRPVDELVHRVEAELDRHREIADLVLERLGADAGGEVVEHLAVLTARLVQADPALDRLGGALGRQAHLQPLAVDDVAVLEVATDVRDVRGDRVVARADRRAVEADVRDVVLAAAVRAAAHLHVDPPRQRVGDPHGRDALADRGVQAHRARDAELARVGAGARDDVVDLVRARLAEAELVERAPDLVDGFV